MALYAGLSAQNLTINKCLPYFKVENTPCYSLLSIDKTIWMKIVCSGSEGDEECNRRYTLVTCKHLKGGRLFSPVNTVTCCMDEVKMSMFL